VSYIYFVYDQYGNIEQASTTYPQVTPPAQLLVATDETPNAQAALAQRQNYMIQNGQIVPAVTLEVDRSSTIDGQWTVYTVTVKTSDGQPHDLTVNIGGHTIQATGVINQDFTVNVHETVTDQLVPVIVSGQGVVTHETFVGGNNTNKPTQIYTDQSGNLCVAPTRKADMLIYYNSVLPSYVTMPDVATGVGILMQAVFGILFPALTSGDNPLVSLDDNQKNALADITANVLPNIITTLENAAPKPGDGQQQSYDLHYASLVRHLATAKDATNKYVQAIQEIPNLI
jgi:hypothetical protein